LRDMADIMLDFGQAMKDRPYYLAMDYARDMGISEDTLRALIDPRIAAEMAKQQEILKKAGYDKAAKDASDYMQKLRELVTQIEVLVSIINGKLIKTLGPHMERAVEWFARNGDTVAKVVGSVADSIVAMAAIIMPILDTVARGWKNIYDWVTHLGRAINNILPTSWSDNLGAGTAWLLDKLGVKGAVDGMLGITPGGKAAPNSKSQPQSGVLDPMRFFMGMGWTKEQAAGIVANLKHESNLDPHAVGDGGKAYGVAQWHPDRQKNFEKWAGKSIYDSTAEEQMRFVHYELTQGAEKRAGDLLRATNNARQAGEIVSRYYERPAAADAEALKRGATAVQIAQTTEININGGDAMSTGRAVAAEQERVNAQLARNLQTAVR
ncbi:MAG TPA: phage tail tip lysozyme, partial [Methylophilaceae bacterium]